MSGRPSKYSEAVADEICARMAEGESLNRICQDDHIPARGTVMRWLHDDQHPGFRDKYARARQELLEFWADEILDIADDGTNDYMEREENGQKRQVYDGDAVQRSRLRVDSRKWLMSKLAPRKYGDKLELSGNEDHPLTVEIVRFADSNPPK